MALENAAGFCGKIRVEAYDYGEEVLLDDAETTPVCRGSNNKTFHPAERILRVLPQDDVHLVRVTALMQFYPGGPYLMQSEKEVFPYE